MKPTVAQRVMFAVKYCNVCVFSQEEPIEYSTPDTPTLRKVVAAMMDADDPPSPASSVDTETGSVRARSRRSRGRYYHSQWLTYLFSKKKN